MKGYECLSLVVLVIIVCLLVPYTGARNLQPSEEGEKVRRRRLRMMTMMKNKSCQIEEPKSIWLRNSCHGGFVTFTKDFKQRTKVIAQHSGLDFKSQEVELLKESCHDESSGLHGSISTRLYSPFAEKYICFNKRGKIIAKSPKGAIRMGRLCTFFEQTLPSSSSASFVRFQSAYSLEWFLGFDGKRQVSRAGGLRMTLPKRMRRRPRSKKRRKNNPRKCDFAFSTGEFSTTRNLRENFPGLFEHIRKQRLTATISKTRITKTTNDIIVDVESVPQREYYYIESNDERYKPAALQLENEEDDDDDNDDEDVSSLSSSSSSSSSFANFKALLKTYKLKKSASSRHKIPRKGLRKNRRTEMMM